eukprot:TRINITY_DN17731_c0_g1_i3.p1 TRINITY_DN17731_c0_g1~~TRINITY_DN17731_c0_g1_i3.p1  ORF type:complete len:357 (+),score=69.73 TRINITY_DN17731_c0_g1_i3:81-1151(+)
MCIRDSFDATKNLSFENLAKNRKIVPTHEKPKDELDAKEATSEMLNNQTMSRIDLFDVKLEGTSKVVRKNVHKTFFDGDRIPSAFESDELRFTMVTLEKQQAGGSKNIDMHETNNAGINSAGKLNKIDEHETNALDRLIKNSQERVVNAKTNMSNYSSDFKMKTNEENADMRHSRFNEQPDFVHSDFSLVNENVNCEVTDKGVQEIMQKVFDSCESSKLSLNQVEENKSKADLFEDYSGTQKPPEDKKKASAILNDSIIKSSEDKKGQGKRTQRNKSSILEEKIDEGMNLPSRKGEQASALYVSEWRKKALKKNTKICKGKSTNSSRLGTEPVFDKLKNKVMMAQFPGPNRVFDYE